MEKEEILNENTSILDTNFCLKEAVKFMPSWSRLKNSDISIQRMIGITNVTYLIEHNADKSITP